MPLQFNQTKTETAVSTSNTTAMVEVQKYDITADRKNMEMSLADSKELDDIVSQIEVYNLDSIISFGAEAAEKIAQSSDEVLKSVNLSQLDATNEMLTTLTDIMSKFDIAEIQDDPKGIKKLFYNVRKHLDRILEKYNTMGGEVDKIYVQLKQHENDIKQSNQTLHTMFESNVTYYHQLVKYILAGEQAQKELKDHIASR